MNRQTRTGFLHASVSTIALFACLGQAVAQSLTVYESKTDFFANAEIVSTENFDGIPTDTYIAEAAVVIDEVTYDTLLGGDPGDPPYCVVFPTYCWRIFSPLWDRPPVTLPNLLQSPSAAPFDWGDSQVIWFGEDKYATAVGFYFVVPALIASPDPECPLSGWEIIVYEANGTVTNVYIPPEIAANPATAYRGFASSVGITKLELAPEYLDLDCFQTMGWGYDNVSRSAIHDIERALVNDLVTFEPDPSTYSTTRDTAGCPSGYVGKFGFESTLTNISSRSLTELQVEVVKLTRRNLLLTHEGLIGEGESFFIPVLGAHYTDGVLSPGEFVDVPFTVCLRKRRSFVLEVDVFGIVANMSN